MITYGTPFWGGTYSVGIAKSNNGGKTWTHTGLNWTVKQNRTIRRLVIHPTNGDILLAATSVGVYRTTNGGTSWVNELEREYRFEHVRAINDVDGIATIEGRSYIEFDWRSRDPTLLTHIVLGPAADQGQARPFAEDCLRSAGIDPRNVRIQPSSIPYRS